MSSAVILSIAALWSLFSSNQRMPRSLAGFALFFGFIDLFVSTCWAVLLWDQTSPIFDPLSAGLTDWPFDLIISAFIPMLFCVLLVALTIWFRGDGRHLTS